MNRRGFFKRTLGAIVIAAAVPLGVLTAPIDWNQWHNFTGVYEHMRLVHLYVDGQRVSLDQLPLRITFLGARDYTVRGYARVGDTFEYDDIAITLS